METPVRRGWCAAFCGVVVIGLGCSAEPDSGAEAVALVKSELISGASGVGTIDVSSVSADWNTTAWQSESVGVSVGFWQYVAYNAEDTNPAHVQYITTSTLDSSGRPFVDRVVCPGASNIGTNFEDPNEDDDYVDAHLLPATPDSVGLPINWGDPAMYGFDGYVWVSSLRVPSDRIKAVSNYTVNGAKCLRTSDAPGSPYAVSISSALAGACVFAAHEAVDPAPFVTAHCFRRQNGVDSASGNDFFDGGDLFPWGEDSDNSLFASYWDTVTNTLAMYRHYLETPIDTGWAPVPGDTGVHIVGHPLLASNDDSLFILAPSGGTNLSVWKYSGGGFSAGTVVATDLYQGEVELKDNVTEVRGVNFAMQYIWNGTPARLAVVYQSRSGSGVRTTLKLLLCDPVTLACTNPVVLGNSTYDAFMPALAIGPNKTGSHYMNVLSYWSNQTTSGANTVLRYMTYTTTGSSTSSVSITASQRDCPADGVGYWGDYDKMWSTSTVFSRGITDSTDKTCDTTSRANLDFKPQDQHVAVVNFQVP